MCVLIFHKTEHECSHAMNEAEKEAREKKLNSFEQMKLITWAYASK